MAAAAGLATGAAPDVYDSVLMWPIVYFWKICGVFLVDLSYNRFEKWFSVVVLASGVLNIAITPWSVCLVDGWCEDALSTTYRRLYTRLVACTSLTSRAVVVYKIRQHLADYKRLDNGYERSWPMSARYQRCFRAFASSVVTACLILTVPMNLLRLYLLNRYEEYSDPMLLLFFFNVYLQNWSMCCMETHFALLCYAAYLRFKGVNDELSAVRADVMVSNRYPVALRSTRRDDGDEPPSTAAAAARMSVLQDPSGRPLETVIEVLRVRHGLTRESVDQLKNMFGSQLALSLITLCIMTLFDIYNEAFHVSGTISRSKFSYGWMLQYVFRFFVIIITAHNASQEVNVLHYLLASVHYCPSRCILEPAGQVSLLFCG